jgi:Glycosyl hydrolase family 26
MGLANLAAPSFGGGLVPSMAGGAASQPVAVEPSAATAAPTLPGSGPPTSAPSANPIPSGAPPREEPVALGAFIPGASSDPSRIDAYAAKVGAMPRAVMWYQRWAPPWNDFDPKVPNAVLQRGSMPMISWEPQAGEVADPNWSLATIVNGSHDGYIRRWTRAVAAWGRPIYVRLMYEMNGWWSAWGVRTNGNSANEFVPAWRHVVSIAAAEGATNIRWVWAPNVDNDGLGVPFASLYPGDDYVDWVGLDGFNRGTSWSSTSWVDMKTIFAASIRHLREITAKPLMIAETGSSEAGGDKAAWIRTSFAAIPRELPQVRAVMWFNKNETQLGIDWRVDSSSSSLAAFRSVATSDLFSGTLP